MKGIVFNIQKCCTHDGPGIRTTVFLKGCPLRCRWCHNPESHSAEPEVMREDGREEVCGTDMTVQAVMDEVMKDEVFYANSGGGLTLSGGEPLMQVDFAYELLQQAKCRGLHTCVETCGFAKNEDMLRIAKVTDLFLYDWKLTDDRQHQAYTGASNRRIRENLRALDAAGAAIILRCPIIRGVNDTKEHLFGIAEVANSLKHILAIEVEPYHDLGNHKYEKLGSPAAPSFAIPEKPQVEEWIATIRAHTNTTVKKA